MQIAFIPMNTTMTHPRTFAIAAVFFILSFLAEIFFFLLKFLFIFFTHFLIFIIL